MKNLKYFLLEKAAVFIASGGIMLLLLAFAVWQSGVQQSRNVQIMAEKLSKDYAGGGWYPVNGTDYDLEARIVGQNSWVSNAINVTCGDQVEIRMRIASGDGASPELINMAMAYDDTQLADTTKRTENGVRVFDSYESPDVRHVAYVPVGVFTVKSNVWSPKTGAYTLGVTYNGADAAAYRKILIVPPNSEVPFRAVLGFAATGLVCLFSAALTAFFYHRYERKCYAW